MVGAVQESYHSSSAYKRDQGPSIVQPSLLGTESLDKQPADRKVNVEEQDDSSILQIRQRVYEIEHNSDHKYCVHKLQVTVQALSRKNEKLLSHFEVFNLQCDRVDLLV
jgi:hypothetical protein